MNKYNSRKEIENTPFAIVGDEEAKVYTIAVGNKQVTEATFENEKDAEAYVMKRPWDLILNVTALYTEYRINQLKDNQNGTN